LRAGGAMRYQRGTAVGAPDRSGVGEATGRAGAIRHSPPLRAGAAIVTVLLVVGGLLALRAMVPDAQAEPSTTNAAGPDIAHIATFDVPHRFDSLPGRTRLPLPQINGDVVGGGLPPIDGPSRTGAAKAIGLVLQRYCAHPGGTRVRLADQSSGRWNGPAPPTPGAAHCANWSPARKSRSAGPRRVTARCWTYAARGWSMIGVFG
jgi:hypothetical protein